MPMVHESPATAVSQRGETPGDHDALLLQATRRIFVVRRILELTVKRLKSDEGASGHPMGEGQYHALKALYDRPRLMAGELAQRCHVSEPTMSRFLKSLEHGGLIERQTDPDNRRVVWVSLTPAGRAKHDKMAAHFLAKMGEVLAPLSESQLHDVIVAFGHLEHLVGMADDDGGADTDATDNTTKTVGER